MMEGQSEGEDSQNGWLDYIPACRSHWKDGHIAAVVSHEGEVQKFENILILGFGFPLKDFYRSAII